MAKRKAVGGRDPREELITLVNALVTHDFGGDYDACFSAYDGDKDKRINWGELTKLLSDAGVGSRWTRRFYVEGVFKELDANKDGFIERSEFSLSFDVR